MAVLESSVLKRRISLGGRCLVGRGPHADLYIPDERVSQDHAAIYFHRGQWKARDLGSRNGTRVGERLLRPGESLVLTVGDRVRFGISDSPWTLIEASSPGPSALNPAGERLVHRGEILELPSPEEALGTIRFQERLWVCDHPDGVHPVQDGEEIEIAANKFLLELPTPETFAALAPTSTTLQEDDHGSLSLSFFVAQAEEHIRLDARLGEQKFPLGSRTHNYPLLILARHRLADLDDGHAEAECGWLEPEELARHSGVDRKHLNLQLWRAIQGLRRLGLPAEALIERRLDSGQLRLGVAQVSIHAS